jgi:hypothetical protein
MMTLEMAKTYDKHVKTKLGQVITQSDKFVVRGRQDLIKFCVRILRHSSLIDLTSKRKR